MLDLAYLKRKKNCRMKFRNSPCPLCPELESVSVQTQGNMTVQHFMRQFFKAVLKKRLYLIVRRYLNFYDILSGYSRSGRPDALPQKAHPSDKYAG